MAYTLAACLAVANGFEGSQLFCNPGRGGVTGPAYHMKWVRCVTASGKSKLTPVNRVVAVIVGTTVLSGSSTHGRWDTIEHIANFVFGSDITKDLPTPRHVL